MIRGHWPPPGRRWRPSPRRRVAAAGTPLLARHDSCAAAPPAPPASCACVARGCDSERTWCTVYTVYYCSIAISRAILGRNCRCFPFIFVYRRREKAGGSASIPLLSLLSLELLCIRTTTERGKVGGPGAQHGLGGVGRFFSVGRRRKLEILVRKGEPLARGDASPREPEPSLHMCLHVCERAREELQLPWATTAVVEGEVAPLAPLALLAWLPAAHTHSEDEGPTEAAITRSPHALAPQKMSEPTNEGKKRKSNRFRR